MYKIAGSGVVMDGMYIAPGGNRWAEYLAWVDAGGVATPEFTDQELSIRISELIAGKGRELIDQTGPATYRGKDRKLSRSMRLLHKKVNGQLDDPGEIQELDSADALSDLIEQIEQVVESEKNWILAEERTRIELEAYDIQSINWPS